jgi:antitoxin component YwqK of YwqJK toxin-antitoxin module/Tfp pilus assembly protein PilF
MKNFLLFFFLIISIYTNSSAQNIELINSGELLVKGRILYDSAEYKKAILLYDKIGRSDTNYVRALFEKALSCEADSQYTKSISFCEEALSLKNQREFEPEIFNTYGNTLSDMGQSDRALKVFDAAIAKYPGYSLLYFNKGIVMLFLDSLEKAQEMFQKTLLIDPYMYSAHFQLGMATLRQGKIIPAFLSFMGYLLMNPLGKYTSRSISLLNSIALSKDEILDYKNKRINNPERNYKAIEEIVLSGIALDKQYKPIIALDDAISRQIQVVLEKLQYDEHDQDFYMQYYFPFYNQVYNSHQFELLINHLFAGVQIAQIKEYNKKMKKEIQGLVSDAAAYFDELRSTRELFFKKRAAVLERFVFDEGNLNGKGVRKDNNKIYIGPWEFFYAEGNLKSKGQYSDMGDREGDWSFYYYSGSLQAKEHYIKGKLYGEQEYFFRNGQISSRVFYANDLEEGVTTSYYYAGNIKSTTHYKLGKKEGEETQYYSNGNIMSVSHYNADIQSGLYKVYFKTGGTKEMTQYENGKLEGPYKSFYENGSLSDEGQLKNGITVGDWKYYFEDGKLKEKRYYISDKQEGPNEEYYETGQLASKYNYKQGLITGEALHYDLDGNIYSKYDYVNGIVISAKFLEKTGKVISTSERQKNMTDIISFTADGSKKSHQRYNKNGNLEGADTIFYASGKINQINEYKDGKTNGTSLTYYLNGNEKSEINMTDDNEDGYYKGFYDNRHLESEGWFIKGQAQGEWDYYDELGKLSSKSYFLNGEADGYKEEFLPNGRKSLEEKFNNGWLETLTQFDSLGLIMLKDSFPLYSGKYLLIYPNGQPMVQADFVRGGFEGLYTTFYFDGSTESISFYKNDMADSLYRSFYYGGLKNTEGQFFRGKKTGSWKSYDEDGKLSTTAEYKEDLMDGLRKNIYPSGQTEYEAFYKGGFREGVLKKYDINGMLAYQVKYEKDDAKTYTYIGKEGKLIAQIPINVAQDTLKTYFPNGSISRKCNFNDGKPNGTDCLYYSNNNIRLITSVGYGIYNGSYKEYFPDGKLKLDYNYSQNNLNGLCRDYYSSGILKEESYFENGLCQGPAKYFDELGKLHKTMRYYYGKLLSSKNEK